MKLSKQDLCCPNIQNSRVHPVLLALFCVARQIVMKLALAMTGAQTPHTQKIREVEKKM